VSAAALDFERPALLQATATPEDRGLARDAVRLLVSGPQRVSHRIFRDLPGLLRRGDLLVVNESATLPASLPARSERGPFLLNLSTRYGPHVWLAEPRWSVGRPGPFPLTAAEEVWADGVRLIAIGPYPGIDRLWFFRAEVDLAEVMARAGAPIRYGYLGRPHPLKDYQTIFARVPGSSEMPSAGRPFTRRTLDELHDHGVGIASIVLHTGVSSLELEPGSEGDGPPVYPEPFEVPPETARAVRAARGRCGRVIAVGTTVLRALETAWVGGEVVPSSGFTLRVLGPGRPMRAADALITGLHDPRTSHLALLFGFAGEERVRSAYAEAVDVGYLWHEFGDSHLLWRDA
jgi:S-adenosylmethionine:tRNA ribosyltransferase-isomerase